MGCLGIPPQMKRGSGCAPKTWSQRHGRSPQLLVDGALPRLHHCWLQPRLQERGLAAELAGKGREQSIQVRLPGTKPACARADTRHGHTLRGRHGAPGAVVVGCAKCSTYLCRVGDVYIVVMYLYIFAVLAKVAE